MEQPKKVYRGSPRVKKFFKLYSKSLFKNRAEAHAYMEQEVYTNPEFIIHIEETAKTNKVSYLVAYTVITDYLTDIIYEIDQTVAKTKTRKKIYVHSYFHLQIGFMESFKNKKLFIESYVKKLNYGTE